MKTVEPTEVQIQQADNDFFTAKNRLEQQLADAERAENALLPPPVNAKDAEPWETEPTPEAVQLHMRIHGLTYADAHKELKTQMDADAKRLAAFAPASKSEISAALAEAEAARARAETLLENHKAVLESLTTQIFAVGNLRRKIKVAQTLALDDAGAKTLAHSAIDYFLDMRTTSVTVRNSSGFRSSVEDLCFRNALKNHLVEYVTPLEKQVQELIKSIRTEAKARKIDLKKVLSLLASERGTRGGQSLQFDSEFYEGLI